MAPERCGCGFYEPDVSPSTDTGESVFTLCIINEKVGCDGDMGAPRVTGSWVIFFFSGRRPKGVDPFCTSVTQVSNASNNNKQLQVTTSNKHMVIPVPELGEFSAQIYFSIPRTFEVETVHARKMGLRYGCFRRSKIDFFWILRPFPKDLYRRPMWTLPLGMGDTRNWASSRPKLI